ncbi:MAG TPA: F0F1 ATP synthase subunit delta, partial [Coxiellaceae bacterium]|nr:F0F1 ATP synthase subunit delta [Coxiellaceae bacterium]
CELTPTQKEQFLVALQKRYNCEILLQCHIDSALIGGAVVYISDKVIDGSIKGMLQKLKLNLLFKD